MDRPYVLSTKGGEISSPPLKRLYWMVFVCITQVCFLDLELYETPTCWISPQDPRNASVFFPGSLP